MGGSQTNNPSSDVSNSGSWTIVGGSGTLNSVLLSGGSDTLYLKCPVGTGGATISFPTDVSLPAGAVVSSVSIVARVGTGANIGSVDPSIAPCLIIDAITSDDTSRFLSRRVFPTSTITTVTVATHVRDASGLPWDIERLNRAYLRVRCNAGVADALRIYQLYFVINFLNAPSVTISSPSGTVLTPSPFLSWVYNHLDGDALGITEYKIFTQAQVAATSFDPNAATPVYQGRLIGDRQSITLPAALPPDTYWLYVRCFSIFGIVCGWIGRLFTVAGASPGKPGDALGGGSSGSVTVVGDPTEGNVGVSLSDTSNLLSVQAASAANTADGIEYTTTNCTLAQDPANPFVSTELASWAMTPTTSADASATTFWVEVEGGAPITARAQFRAATAPKGCVTSIQFADSNIVYMAGSDISGTTVTSLTTSWAESVTSTSVPLNASYARAVLTVKSATAGQVHDFDHVCIAYGTGTPYSDGGLTSRNILSSWYATAEGTAPSGQSWVGGTATSAAVAAITGIGNKAHQLTYTGAVAPTLALRAASTTFSATTSGTAYTLNKPTGTATGDLMVAFISASTVGTLTPPAGWSVVASPQASPSAGSTALWVLKRSATSVEPTTWTDGYLGTAATQRYAVVVGYSGAADASLQFVADAASQSPTTTPTLTNPTINNTDPNAWRLSAFAVNTPVSGGTLASNKLAPARIPITYVGTGTSWSATDGWSSSSVVSFSYTINKPTAVVSGDLMIAALSFDGVGTVTPPTGWTLSATKAGPNNKVTGAILIRTAGASEPASWSSTLTTTQEAQSGARATTCSAYRGADVTANQFLAKSSGAASAANSVGSGNATNTDSYSWSFTAFMADSSSTGSFGLPNVQRASRTTSTGTGKNYSDATTIATGDSNGSVTSGTFNSNASFGSGFWGNSGFYDAVAFECFIKSSGATGSPGANETQRVYTQVGSLLSTGVYDSAAIVSTGNTQTVGTFTPGSGTTVNSMAGWNGMVKPLGSMAAGLASISLAAPVDISAIDPSVLALAGNKVTVTTQAAGVSTTGTPYLKASFYRANVLITSSIAAGNSFPLYPSWTKSSSTFDLPAGTTRIGLTLLSDGLATGNSVYFKRIGVSLGPDATWRNGTDQAAHPVWAVPHIQHADDSGEGFSQWLDLVGGIPVSYDYLSGGVEYFDETIVPLIPRKYRARTVSYGLAGDQFVSGWSQDTQAVRLQTATWWLKDLSKGTKLALKVAWNDLAVKTTGTSTSFQALGEDLPIVVTEGYKGDTIKLDLRPVDRADWGELRDLLNSGRTLFLQSDYDQAWWVRTLGDVDANVLASNMRQSNPVRDVTVTFLQIAPGN